jgi:hypothetical protein
MSAASQSLLARRFSPMLLCVGYMTGIPGKFAGNGSVHTHTLCGHGSEIPGSFSKRCSPHSTHCAISGSSDWLMNVTDVDCAKQLATKQSGDDM